MIPYLPHKYLFSIGSIKIETEAFGMTLAFIIFIILVARELKKQKEKMNSKDIFWFLIITLLSALAGGRLWYYIANWKGPETLITILDITKAGLVSFGMLIGGAIGILIWVLLKKKKNKKYNTAINIGKFADILALYIGLWIFIFRGLGCFIDGHIIGKGTTILWALQFPNGTLHHPTALYLALNGLFIFIILKMFFGKEKTKESKFGKRFNGEIALWFLLLYCCGRFWIEFLRVGANLYYGLSLGQWVSLCLLLLTLFALIGAYEILKINKIRTYFDNSKMKKSLLSYNLHYHGVVKIINLVLSRKKY